MEALESVLSGVPFLEGLRPDELARVARQLSLTTLATGERRAFAATLDEARLVIVVRGHVRLEVDSAAGVRRSDLVPGDCHGEIALLTGHARPVRLTAVSASTLATLDRAGLDALLAAVPVIALPLAEELAVELRAEDDVVRQLLELHAEALPPAQLEAAIASCRRVIGRRGARVTRLSPRALFQRLVVARGAEPPFWMLLGFLASLGGARLVVHLILKYGLEKRLFALVPGNDPNPMHVHHFNYGLILIGSAGIAALVPLGRRALRVLAVAFGAGAGLVFDEFGLIYNLNPEYAQQSSLISAAIVAALLVQLTWFGRFWAALGRRAWFTLPERPMSEPATSIETAALGKVAYLEGLDAETLAEIAARATRRRYAPGERIVAELEPGADVYVLTAGEAEISVDCASGDRRVLGKLGPGGAFGEMSSLTGELRSATVTALTDVEALILADADFDRLRERRPEVALHLVRLLAARLASAERSVEALLGSAAPAVEAPHRHQQARRGSVRRAWRELVVNHERDLAFLTLAAFVLTLIGVRLLVFGAFHFEVAPRGLLRSAYLTGFTLLIVSSCTSLLTFRPGLRRLVAVAYGVGLALILNELGVTLAFDIFFKDIHTADPDVPFDIERLYRRAEPLRAIALGLLVLVQAAYLRRFYRRAVFVMTTRLRKLVARG